MPRNRARTPAPGLRERLLRAACDEILSNAGAAELARLDELLGAAIATTPEQWRRLAGAREAALQYAEEIARVAFVAGLGQAE